MDEPGIARRLRNGKAAMERMDDGELIVSSQYSSEHCWNNLPRKYEFKGMTNNIFLTAYNFSLNLFLESKGILEP